MSASEVKQELRKIVYKLEKEKYIKEVADKWKDNIDIMVYEALMNYEVSIYD